MWIAFFSPNNYFKKIENIYVHLTNRRQTFFKKIQGCEEMWSKLTNICASHFTKILRFNFKSSPKQTLYIKRISVNKLKSY